MSAEDLDKLFRDKLKNRPAAPGNEVWERLQARMQQPAAPEVQNPFLVSSTTEQKEEEARPVIKMWYYSAAAAVTMLLSVGLWVNRDHIDPLQPSAAVATVQESTRPAPAAINTPDVDNIASAVEASTTPSQQETEFNNPVPAAVPQAIASAGSSTEGIARKKEKSVTQSLINEAELVSSKKGQQLSAEPVMVAVNNSARTQATTLTPSESAPLEIVVKLDNHQATTSFAHASTTIDNTPQEEETSGSGRVLKGILKQVKHLKDGEKVDLKEMGISKQTFALETRIGNKKIIKTIEL